MLSLALAAEPGRPRDGRCARATPKLKTLLATVAPQWIIGFVDRQTRGASPMEDARVALPAAISQYRFPTGRLEAVQNASSSAPEVPSKTVRTS